MNKRKLVVAIFCNNLIKQSYTISRQCHAFRHPQGRNDISVFARVIPFAKGSLTECIYYMCQDQSDQNSYNFLSHPVFLTFYISILKTVRDRLLND